MPESSSSSAADPVALCYTELDAGDLFTTTNWAGHASMTMAKEEGKTMASLSGQRGGKEDKRKRGVPVAKEKGSASAGKGEGGEMRRAAMVGRGWGGK